MLYTVNLLKQLYDRSVVCSKTLVIGWIESRISDDHQSFTCQNLYINRVLSFYRVYVRAPESGRLLTVLKPDRYQNIVKYGRSIHTYEGASFYDVKPYQHPCQREFHIFQPAALVTTNNRRVIVG